MAKKIIRPDNVDKGVEKVRKLKMQLHQLGLIDDDTNDAIYKLFMSIKAIPTNDYDMNNVEIIKG